MLGCLGWGSTRALGARQAGRWAPGNAIAIIIEGTGKRVAETFDTDPGQAPLLHLTYLTP